MDKDEKGMKLLKEGDVFELKEGTVYARVPKHFLYANYNGVFDEFDEGPVNIKELNLTYLQGTYTVHHTSFDGGGSTIKDGDYPNGHHVWCRKIDDEKTRVHFYQTGSFTAMIFNIEPISESIV